MLDDKTPGCADFRGNRQCISVGNVDANDRAALILMDYPNRRRLKIYAHAELRDLAEFYYWTRRLQAYFFAGDFASTVHASLRGTAALDVEQFLLIGRQARPHLPQFVDRVDMGNNGVMTRALQPLECYLPKAVSGGLPDRLCSGRGRASLDVVKSPRMSYILGHFYQKIV